MTQPIAALPRRPRPYARPLQLARTGRVLAGLCQGLAAWLDLEVGLVRLAFLIGLVFYWPITIATYALLWVATPRAPKRRR
jgi:phage shock protein PspC (stress-responsive transcriptional regulator)